MTDFFNKVKQHFQNNLPFVIYKKPNTELINGLLQNDDKLNISQNLSESGFIFSSFDTNKKILIPKYNIIKLLNLNTSIAAPYTLNVFSEKILEFLKFKKLKC